MTSPRQTITKKNIRVLHIVSHYKLGGAEKCTFELSRIIGDRVEMGVAAILGDDSSELGQSMTCAAKTAGTKIYDGTKLPWKFGGAIASSFKLRRVVRNYQPDIVHLNTEIPEFAYALCIRFNKSLRNIPIVRTIHNTVLWTRWKHIGKWCEITLGDTPVIYVSNEVRKSFQEWRRSCGLKNVSKDTTIYNPIAAPLPRKSLINPRVKNGDIRLLFAGRFEFQKGCDLLPEIARLINAPANTQLSLYIYGEGPNKDIMKKLQNTPPPGCRVQLAPPLTNIVEALPNFDVLLFPSRFEGYGRLAAEATLVGIPVVAFSLPVLFEIFPHDYPWLSSFNDKDLTCFADKVTALLASFEDAQPIVDNAKYLLRKKLDPENTALAYINFYTQIYQR